MGEHLGSDFDALMAPLTRREPDAPRGESPAAVTCEDMRGCFFGAHTPQAGCPAASNV